VHKSAAEGYERFGEKLAVADLTGGRDGFAHAVDARLDDARPERRLARLECGPDRRSSRDSAPGGSLVLGHRRS